MGVKLSRLVKRLLVQRDVKILMVGLDASGFNVEAVEYKSINFTVWDIGGQEKIRPLWRHYLRNIKGLVFVVDSNDRLRISEARNALHGILTEDELHDVTLLVFANKQDLPHAMRVPEVADKLGLHLIHQPKWYIQGMSATTGQGLYEGLDWLSSNLSSKAAAKDSSCFACVTPRK